MTHHFTCAKSPPSGTRVRPPFWSVNTIPAVMTTDAMSFAALRRRKPFDSCGLSVIEGPRRGASGARARVI